MTRLRAGDWVEVRSQEEILRTLDDHGRLERLPFMPQMFKYCGQRFKVYKRAHKTCDTINFPAGRRLPDCIHLELRCNGEAYGGCQAACLIFWKAAWLKPVDVSEDLGNLPPHDPRPVTDRPVSNPCTEAHVLNATSSRDPGAKNGKKYICQATQLLEYTTPLQWYDFRQYLEDYISGNVRLSRLFYGFVYASYYWGALCYRGRLGIPSRWLYDRAQVLLRGGPFPRRRGRVSDGQSPPATRSNLRVGEWVRVKPYEQILATLDQRNKNRGLFFDAELVPYCGGTYRVRTQVHTFINEKTGRLTEMKTPAVILEGVWCRSRYSDCRMSCPRSIYAWWRENWLERVEPATGEGNGTPVLD